MANKQCSKRKRSVVAAISHIKSTIRATMLVRSLRLLFILDIILVGCDAPLSNIQPQNPDLSYSGALSPNEPSTVDGVRLGMSVHQVLAATTIQVDANRIPINTGTAIAPRFISRPSNRNYKGHPINELDYSFENGYLTTIDITMYLPATSRADCKPYLIDLAQAIRQDYGKFPSPPNGWASNTDESATSNVTHEFEHSWITLALTFLRGIEGTPICIATVLYHLK